MRDWFSDGAAFDLGELAPGGLAGGRFLGSFHNQKFYALRADGGGLRFPFSPCPFVALVDLARPADEAMLRNCSGDLIRHGCVQALCRGEESGRLVGIFEELAEAGKLAGGGEEKVSFTAMSMEDEPREEAVEYFSLPCGLAEVKLLLIIGDEGEFQAARETFFRTMGDSGNELAGEAAEEIPAGAALAGLV
ncbi:MAG: hypothetical protein LBU64_13970 [Planctomycetota bacterium]|jgi:hypothetical protein|nr:hypothetical protein [Planctomycetota bacterium]